MAEYNRLDDNGLLYLLQLLKGEMDGRANVIETIKVDGVPLTPDAQKAVNIILTDYAKKSELPTKLSELENDGDGTAGSAYATEEYVNENGGKIDVIKVNGTVQTITNKQVDLPVPIVELGKNQGGQIVSLHVKTPNGEGFKIENDDLDFMYFWTNEASGAVSRSGQLVTKVYTDKTYRTEAQVQQAIDDALADVENISFSEPMLQLPATGQKNIIYLVAQGSTIAPPYSEYIWLEPTGGTPHFELIGSTTVDLSGYVQASEMKALTNAQIDTIFNQVFGPGA